MIPREKLYLWALLRIYRGDRPDDPLLESAGYGVVGGGGYDPVQIAEAAVRGDEEKVCSELPSGMTRDMILGSP